VISPQPLLAVYQARLALHEGEAERAFRLLRKGVLKRGDLGSIEAWLLLAIAARETEHPKELDQALKELRELSVDVTPLSDATTGR